MKSLIFEDQWRNAFDDAESTPADAVWLAVESDLVAAENIKIKRTVIIYQRIAAASTVFALMLGLLSYHYWSDLSYTRLAQGISQPKRTDPLHVNPSGMGNAPSLLMNRVKGGKDATVSVPKGPSGIISGPHDEQTYASLPIRTGSDSLDRKMMIRESLVLDVIKEWPIKIKMTPVERISLPEKLLPVGEAMLSRPTLWASIGASTGVYSPEASGTSASLGTAPSSPGNSASTSHSAFGTSNSIWAMIGRRIFTRWLLQGGITYLKQSLGYTSNLVATASSQQQTFAQPYNPTLYSAVTTLRTYPINSVLEYVSIPVQTGYMILNGKIGLQINAGVSADLFVHNSLRDETGLLSNFSKGPGPDSPYRSLNWAGLASAELTYRLSRQYSLSIVPGVRYCFESALKNGADHPNVKDVGFRFRYNLR